MTTSRRPQAVCDPGSVHRLGLVSFALTLLACGGGGGDADPDARPDDPDHDAAVADAAPPDAVVAAPLTAVVVTEAGTPAQGETVVFHDETGAPIADALTDADGRAVGPAVVTGAVTYIKVYAGEATYHGLVTKAGLPGGATAAFTAWEGPDRRPRPAPAAGGAALLDVRVPDGYPEGTTRIGYVLQGSGGELGVTGSFFASVDDLSRDDEGEVDLVVIASGGVSKAYQVKTDLTAPAGETTVVTFDTPWQGAATTALTVTDAPAGEVAVGLAGIRHTFPMWQTSASQMRDAVGDAAFAFEHAPIDSVRHRIAISFGSDGVVTRLGRVTGDAAPLTVAAGELLPRFTEHAVADPLALTWTADGPLTAADAVMGWIAGDRFYWELWTPPSASPLVFPTLPAAIIATPPGASDVTGSGVEARGLDFVDGYPAFVDWDRGFASAYPDEYTDLTSQRD